MYYLNILNKNIKKIIITNSLFNVNKLFKYIKYKYI